MATNILAHNALGLSDITPSLASNAVSLLALRQNAYAIYTGLDKGHNFGTELYVNQKQETQKRLLEIINMADNAAADLSRAINHWNTATVETLSEFTSSTFTFPKEDPDPSRPSVFQLLSVFRGTKLLEEQSNKLNSSVILVSKDSQNIASLEAKLEAAIQEVQASEQTLVQAKIGGAQDESAVIAAEDRAEFALLKQMAAYQSVISAHLNHPAGALDNLTLRFPTWGDIKQFCTDAGKAIATGVTVAKDISQVLGY